MGIVSSVSQDLFDPLEQAQLLQIARSSVEYGLTHEEALPVNPTEFSPNLQEPGAAFVTLETQGQLRGCIGSVKARRPLVIDVSKNAWNAAFHDTRFKPLKRSEFNDLHFEISILTHPKPMTFSSEENLKQQLVPGTDGLILKDGYRRGLFLPSVWEKLPDIDTFLSHLKQKAGFPDSYWSETLEVERFYSFEFSDDDF
ncbi:AmmeMemoRadiSam system protein A [bacterium]|nr:AmmeMemoRadiSam system protein A [bacterium]